jgi:uncharacterized protein YbjT (DUF2867 family)
MRATVMYGAGVDAIVFTLGSDGTGKVGAETVDYGGVRNVLPYTIVRPGWFDYNAANEHRLVLLQGDKRHAGDPSDGVIARRQIAEVLVGSLAWPEADRKTFELVATSGAAQQELGPLFAALDADPPGSLDAVHDTANMPPEEEPLRVRRDLDAHTRREP